MYSNTWSPVGSAVPELLGYGALLEEVHHWGPSLRAYILTPLAVFRVWLRHGVPASCPCQHAPLVANDVTDIVDSSPLNP